MSKTKLKLLLLLLFPLGLLLNIGFKLSPYTWESFYSLCLNKGFIQALSLIFGIIPFSVFEWLIYGVICALIFYLCYVLFKCIQTPSKCFVLIGHSLLNLTVSCAVIFICFTAFWGLNYHRPRFNITYDMPILSYEPEELGQLYGHLLKLASTRRQLLPEDEEGLMTTTGDFKSISTRAQLGFDAAATDFPSLAGRYGNAKPILASRALNYTGITGIYSPFTGEPNVNTSVPVVTLPATTCHEMAHQRGYGFENECNFIAYITCLAHPDTDFQYSGLIMAISYISNALARIDFELLKTLNDAMDPKVYADLVSINAFWDQYKGEIQQVSEEINDSYLKFNGVTDGTASYGEMVELLLAFHSKYAEEH